MGGVKDGRQTMVLGYAMAAALILAAWLLRGAIEPVVGTDLPLILFFPSVIVAAFVGGLRFGLAVTVIGCAVGLSFVPPKNVFWPVAPVDWARTLAYLAAGALVSWLVSSRRRGWERSNEILESIGDAFYAVDSSFRFTYVNQRAERWWGRRREELLGRSIWSELSEALGGESHAMHLKVMRERVPVQFEARSGASGKWIDVSIYPEAGGGLSCYVRDITERKQAEEALRETDRRKDEFLAVLGHELRNPLAPLRTGLELLAEARTRPELTASVLEMMERQIGHLVHLVDDLLDVSRITRGDIHLQPAVPDLRTIVDAAVDLARPLIDERCHELSVERVESPLLVFGDFQRLTQVLANLLGNAAKYTDPGGKIRVGFGTDEGHAIVRVADTGFGIPPDRLEDVFGMFSRIPEHRARLGGGGGLGVGLALSRQLVELHNGTIEAASEGLGRGSEFTVRLPLWRKHAPVTTGARRDARRTDTWRVLVVDDNVDAAESLRALLQLQGHETRTVYDGAAALEAVERLHPDLVLLDIGLPQIDGYEVARRIRALPDGENIRLWALTGWGQDEDKRRADGAGFDEHLTKPVDYARLAALMRRGRTA